MIIFAFSSHSSAFLTSIAAATIVPSTQAQILQGKT